MNLKKNHRKGFSLVELVVVILIIAILAVAVFAGGSAVIKKSQISRAESDLHNFSVAVESFMNENPKVANVTGQGSSSQLAFAQIVTKLNANLAEDYQIVNDATTADSLKLEKTDTAKIGQVLATSSAVADSNGNITLMKAGDVSTNVAVYQTIKEDPWGNPYFVIIDSNERHGTVNSDFYIYVVTAGPDAKTDLAGTIGGDTAKKADDVFLLVQYEDGDVSAVTYDMSSLDEITVVTDVSADNAVTTGKVQKSAGEARYCMPAAAGTTATGGIQNKCPINW